MVRLTMAMVVMAVVNHGNLPLPYLVESIRDAHGKILQTEPARRLGDHAFPDPDQLAVGPADAVVQRLGLPGRHAGHEVVPAR